MADILALCVVTGGAAFTLTYLLRYTTGPFHIFSKFRWLAGVDEPVYEGDTNVIVDWIENIEPEGFFAELVYCFWCLTTWISLIVAIGAYFTFDLHNMALFPFLWLFSTGMSGILNSLLE